MAKPTKLIISIFTPLLTGFIGSYFTAPNIDTWYSTLNKPTFNPPNWIFGPVWTTLYILMGISLYLVWTNPAKKNLKKIALKLFFAQLILNSLWSIIFFGLQNPALAFIELAILWIFIILTIINFYKISQTAAYLLIPYILWVSFAAALNLSIVILN